MSPSLGSCTRACTISNIINGTSFVDHLCCSIVSNGHREFFKSLRYELADQALLRGGIRSVLKSRRIFPSPNHCLSNSSNSRWQTSLNQSDPMPATLDIDQIISSPLVVSKTDSLFSPASVKASGGVFTLLYKTPPSIEYHLPAILYLTTSHQIPNLPPNRSFPSQKSLLHPTNHFQQRNPRLLHLRTEKKEKRKKKERNGIRPRL